MFSTDYPHWDFDHPQQVFGGILGAREKAQVFRDNAKAFYGHRVAPVIPEAEPQARLSGTS